MDKIFGYRYYDSTANLDSSDYVRADVIVIDNVPYYAIKGFSTVATIVYKVVQPGQHENVFQTAVRNVDARWLADSGIMYTYDSSILYTHDLLTDTGLGVSYTSIGSMGVALTSTYIGGHISSAGEEIVDVVGTTDSYTLWWCRWTDRVQGTPVELSRTPVGDKQTVYSDIISQEDKVIFYINDFVNPVGTVYKCEIDVGTTDQTYTLERVMGNTPYSLYVSPDARYYKNEEPPVLAWDRVGEDTFVDSIYDFTSGKIWDLSSYPYYFSRDAAILWLSNKDFMLFGDRAYGAPTMLYCSYEREEVSEINDEFKNGFMNDNSLYLALWPEKGPITRGGGSGLFQSPDFRFTLLGTREADPGVSTDFRGYQVWRDKGRVDA